MNPRRENGEELFRKRIQGSKVINSFRTQVAKEAELEKKKN